MAVEPLAPARVQFTASAELHDKLNRLRALMRSSVPDGDLAAIIEEAVTEKLERLESRRFAKTNAPRKSLEQTDTSPSSRYIPAAVKRAVRERDGDQCAFVDEHARRCTERDGLEFHHHQPFGRGGDHSPENVRMMCSVHNGYLAERDYGKELMNRYRRSGSCAREPGPVYSIGNRAAPAQQVDSFHAPHSGFFLGNSLIAADTCSSVYKKSRILRSSPAPAFRVRHLPTECSRRCTPPAKRPVANPKTTTFSPLSRKPYNILTFWPGSANYASFTRFEN